MQPHQKAAQIFGDFVFSQHERQPFYYSITYRQADSKFQQETVDLVGVFTLSLMSDSLTRCNALMACWVSVLGWTKRIDGREAASHMASASTKSFLLLLTNGRTNCGEISLVSCPKSEIQRAIKCAPAQASITTTEGGHVARNCISLVRVNFFTQKSLTRLVLTMNVEGVLSEIDTNKCDVLHDGLSVKGIYLNSVLLLRWGGDHIIIPTGPTSPDY